MVFKITRTGVESNAVAMILLLVTIPITGETILLRAILEARRRANRMATLIPHISEHPARGRGS